MVTSLFFDTTSMPLFVHHPEYRCTQIRQIVFSQNQDICFELIIKKAGTPFENTLVIRLDKDCTKLSYSMEKNPKIAYQLDFAYLSLDNKIAVDVIERYLLNRTNKRFTELNGDIFFYILLLSDFDALDDFLDDPFTFRVLAERVKRNQPIDYLVKCNRHTLILCSLAEHIANFDDSLSEVHQSFIECAWMTPAIYRWLQNQPLDYVEKTHVHATLSHQYQVDCVYECILLLELMRSPIKQRNQLISHRVGIAELLESIKAYGPQMRYYKLLEELSLLELVKLRANVPGRVENYMCDISTMLVGAMVRGEEFDTPTTARGVVKLHDDLVLAQAGYIDLGIGDSDDEYEDDLNFPILPIDSLPFVKPITCISELRAESAQMRHCIYSANYIEKLLSGNYFAYRVLGKERATLLLVYLFGALKIDELSGFSNARVSTVLIDQIDRAVATLKPLSEE